MLKEKNCIRGFINSNLGDDLFIYLLCRRYQNEKFVLYGPKRARKNFDKLKNLQYIEYDSNVIRWPIRMLNLIPNIVNHICNKEILDKKQIIDIITPKCKNNILIVGSYFIQTDRRGKFYFEHEEKYYNLKPYVLGSNFGPYYTDSYLLKYRKLLSKAKQVSFRDSYSASLVNIKGIEWHSDILFTYDLKDCIKPNKSDYVLISVVNSNKDGDNNEIVRKKYIDFNVKMINELHKKNENVVLIGFCRNQGDDEVIQQIYNSCEQKHMIDIINYPDVSVDEIVGYFYNSKYVVASRYHAMILGWLVGKNVYPIVYSEKMLHVIQDINSNIKFGDIKDLSENDIVNIINGVKKSIFDLADNLSDVVCDAEKHFRLLDKELNK